MGEMTHFTNVLDTQTQSRPDPSPARLTGCKNFVRKRKKFIFNAFVDLKPVERFENGSDV